MKAMTHTLASLALLALLGTGLCQATTPTRLQVAAASERAKAETVAKTLDQMGYGPAVVCHEGDRYKVRTRLYDSLAEANFAKPRLKGAGFSDAFAVSEAAASGRPCSADSVFGDLGDIDAAQAPSDAAALARLREGYDLLKQANTEAARAVFEAVARDYPQFIEAGEAELRCGYLMLRAKAPEDQVLKRFMKVASAQVPVSVENRVTAMERCAALFHRGKDLDAAEAAYQAIRKVARQEETKARAQLELAAVTMEKSWNGTASLAHARKLCEELPTAYPSAPKQVKACAMLMLLETFCYEKQYGEVLKREAEFRKEHGQSDEAMLASYWFAKARFETGDVATAKQMLDALAESDIETDARFRGVDVVVSAKQLRKQVEKALQDNAKPSSK